jgi:hypothetical protein
MIKTRFACACFLFQSNTPATDQAFATKMHVSTQEISIQTDDYDHGIQVDENSRN